MGTLQVTLFGGVRVSRDEWLTEVRLPREIQALLAYLLLQRHRTHPREALAGIFWGERSQKKARGSLNTALWKLRKALEPEGIPAGTYLNSSHPGEVGFNLESPYWLDIESFEEETAHILTYPPQMADETHVKGLKKKLGLYKGELLEGFYQDWALLERERLRRLYLNGLIYLLHYYRFHGLYEKGIAYGLRILDLDPLREEIHREVMRLYLGNGQRALAARQYELCRSILVKELGISPMEETQTLYTQVFSNVDNSPKPIISNGQIGFDQAIGQLRAVSQTINLANEQIQQTLQMIAKYSEDSDDIFPPKANDYG